ncbi:MAG: homoserine dehydrogenase [Bacteroidales bacterium]|nr:homoserine dehydrogenase [Bacteroidales bacterium]
MNGIKKIKLGIFGFGCVGQGLYNVLQQTKGIHAEIEKICIKHPEKKRTIDSHFFTTDKNEILNNPNIDVVVELIDDADAAFKIVSTALKNKKAVVSANKKMIAENFSVLHKLQQENNTSFLYEGACCASIPIIRNLEEYYDNDLLNSVEGIFNGSTNYILTNIFQSDKSFQTALAEAQKKGFAESDPRLDVEGFDPKYKLTIILAHAFGLFIKPEQIFNFGIQRLNEFDINFAKEKNLSIKLIAKCKKTDSGKIYAYCLPKLVAKADHLHTVNYEFNGISIEGAFSETQFFIGKGAGGYPTGSAVLSDISALTYQYKYEYKKVNQQLEYEITNNVILELYVRYNNESEICFNDFESISVKYYSEQASYIIGKISLEKLSRASWLKHKDISLLLTENNF